MNKYFTADFHLNHKNIIEYCNRPFDSVEEMNDTLIDNTNAIVGRDDILYYLGDFALSPKQISELRARINCQNIILIMGNHDPHDKKDRPHPVLLENFQSVHNMLRVKVVYKEQKKSIILNHYAMRVWRNSHHGSWHLYAHSHGNLYDDLTSLSFDVGVDCHNFMPLNVDQIGAIMETKIFKPVDHHNERII